MSTLLVGCPLRNRNWAMPHWLEHLQTAAERVDVDLSYVFVVENHDTQTRNWLWDNITGPLYIEITYDIGRDANHVWKAEDFPRMTGLRNNLLGKVRSLEPDNFLSLDSDLFLEPNALVEMYEALEHYDAVGIKTSMCRHLWCESWMYYAPSPDVYVRTQEQRPDGHQPVDAIMAGKMMSPAAYKVNYKNDPQGEDLGWCRNAKAAGLHLGIAGNARHCMHEDDLSGAISFSR